MFTAEEKLVLDVDRAVWREVGDEVIILDLSTTTYFTLNGSARVLWKLLDSGATPSELTSELSARFGVEDPQASSDVAAFLKALEAQCLLAKQGG